MSADAQRVKRVVLTLRNNQWIVLLAACAVAVALPSRRNASGGILLVVYLYMTLVFIIAFNLGVWTTPEDVAVLFCVLTAIFPVLIYDKTWRIGLFLGAWTLFFCLMVWHMKTPVIAANDTVHQCIVLALAVFLAYHTSKMKVGAIKYRASIEVERDVDALCGIANRRRFDLEMHNVMPGMRAEDVLGVLMADIDLFKSYNDTYGHQEGDECLRRVAGAMDSVASKYGLFLARYGGEEFACIIRNRCNVEVSSVAEQMRKAVETLGLPNEKVPEGARDHQRGFHMLRSSGCRHERARVASGPCTL